METDRFSPMQRKPVVAFWAHMPQSARMLLLAALLALPGGSGCDGDSPLMTVKPPTASQPATVQDTFDAMRGWHRRGAYERLRRHIEPAGREGTIDLLVAVDELVAANRAALAAMQREFPGMDRRDYDLSFVLDNLDLFSREVEFVKVREHGDEAVVTAQVSRRLPLAEMIFIRHDGRWMYQSGREQPEIIEHLRAITRALGQITLLIRSGDLRAEQMPEEWRLRIQSRQEKIAQLAASIR